MKQISAPAWRADWLNGWLAAVGVTALAPEVRLSWTDEASPAAVFHIPSLDLLTQVLPTEEELATCVIARDHVESELSFPRKPTEAEYDDRARLARLTSDRSLGSTVSDLLPEKAKDLSHSPFDPPAPAGLTLHDRAMRCRRSIESDSAVEESMAGTHPSTSSNGLGYDLRRLASSCVPGDSLVVDPVVELLSFFGSQLFHQFGQSTRGWKPISMFKPGAFRWATWTEPLNWAGIDSVLDRYYSNVSTAILHQAFESVAYTPTGSADVTRGIGSRPAVLLRS